MNTVTITGAGGFIGSHAVDLFVARGFRVLAFDNNQENVTANLKQHANNQNVIVKIDNILNLKADDLENSEYLIHFAGMMDLVPSIETPRKYMETNVIGTVAALEAARQKQVKRFVYAASSSCYGPTPPLPTSETAPIDCAHPYAESKFQGERAAFHWSRVYKVPVNSIRIFNVLGPRLRGSQGAYGAVLGVFLRQKMAGKPFTVVGTGNQGRDFVHVRDLAKAFYLAAVSEHQNEVFNIGGGGPHSPNDIIRCLGGGEVENLPTRPGEPETTWADISKAKAQLGWEPKISFAEGVAEMVSHIKEFEHIPLWDKDSIQDATKTWFKELGK